MTESSSPTTCPKCGARVRAGAVLCDVCDFVLDVNAVLGDMPELAGAALDGGTDPFGMQAVKDHDLDDPTAESAVTRSDASVSEWSGTALIVGHVAANAPVPSADPDDWLSDVTGATALPSHVLAVPVSAGYATADVHALLEPHVVLDVRPGAPLGELSLTPPEERVLALIDGRRTVARVAKKSGLRLVDVRSALGLLVDRNLIHAVSHVERVGELAGQQTAERDEAPASDAGPTTAVNTRSLGAPSEERSSDEAPPLAVAMPFETHGIVPRATLASSATAGHDATRAAAHHADALGVHDVTASPVLPGATPSMIGTADPLLFSAASAAEGSVSSGAAQRPIAPAGRPPSSLTSLPPQAPLATGRTESALPTHTSAAEREAAAMRAAAEQVNARAEGYLTNAVKEFAQGNKTRGQTYVRMALQVDPANEIGHSLLLDSGKAGKDARELADERKLLAEAQQAEAHGDIDRALVLLRRAALVKPRDAEIHNRIGIVLAVRKLDARAAIAALMKACSLAPTNMAYRSNLGKVIKMSDGAPVPSLSVGELEPEAPPPPETSGKKPSLLDRLRGKRG